MGRAKNRADDPIVPQSRPDLLQFAASEAAARHTLMALSLRASE